MGCSQCLPDSFKSYMSLDGSCVKSVSPLPIARVRRQDGTNFTYATTVGHMSNGFPKMMFFSNYEYAIDYSGGSNLAPSASCGDEMSRIRTGTCQICSDGQAWINYDGIFYCQSMPLPNGYTSGSSIFPPSAGNNCWYERHTGTGICYACNYPYTLTATQSCQPVCPIH